MCEFGVNSATQRIYLLVFLKTSTYFVVQSQLYTDTDVIMMYHTIDYKAVLRTHMIPSAGA